uniref:Protein kinase domain-containing protein n=1 Tax=Strigamia maritima TaxID=126957 RepID=T1JLC3_STRMM
KSSHLKFDFPHEVGVGIDCLLPHSSAACRELIKLMCTYDPDDRISAQDCLSHQYFKKYRLAKRRDRKLMTTKVMEPAAATPSGDGKKNSMATDVSRETVSLQLRPLRKSTIKPRTKLTALETETSVKTLLQKLPKINTSSASSSTSKKIIPKLQKSPLKNIFLKRNGAPSTTTEFPANECAGNRDILTAALLSLEDINPTHILSVVCAQITSPTLFLASYIKTTDPANRSDTSLKNFDFKIFSEYRCCNARVGSEEFISTTRQHSRAKIVRINDSPHPLVAEATALVTPFTPSTS